MQSKSFDKQYEVLDNGEVYSRQQTTSDGRRLRGRFLKQHIQNSGYYLVQLYDNGKMTNHSTHRLVAKLFVPNPQGKECVNHKDGNKLNNNASNLEWCTQKENSLHARDMGNFPKTNVMSKQKHTSIVKMLGLGVKQIAIAEQHNVSRASVCRINKGKSYKFYGDASA